MPEQQKNEPPAAEQDPAANDLAGGNLRDGAKERRDPKQPAAVVGLGASAGGVAVLQQFFSEMPPESGIAFVVVMHLSPDFESQLASVLQQRTSMPVIQVSQAVRVRPNHVYVIPPNHQLAFEESMLHLREPQQARGRRVTIDLFFRTLAHAFGQRAVCVILSGTDSDGVIGLKHVRAQGGVTIAQDPEEAEFESMPQSAISTGMVDWVLKIGELPAKLTEMVANEHAMRLPPEIADADEPDAKVADAPGGETVSEETRDWDDESAIAGVLKHVRVRTGHDFTHYKRATILRRIARRLQVNSIESIPRYLEFLRTHPAEARSLVHDLLIGVTHFFRDQESFVALGTHIPQIFAGRKAEDEIRVWVAGCASGEEAYSVAMLLCEHAEKLATPPRIQVFATDIDEQAVHIARHGVYPLTIEADVSQERLRTFFRRENDHYQVRKELRDMVLFAAHNLLSDAPFSRVDLVTCRNLLIYLKRHAQEQVFDVFHFALRAGGLLFIGGAETGDMAHTLFTPLDARHRLYVRRSTPRPGWRIPALPLRAGATRAMETTKQRSALRAMSRMAVQAAADQTDESTFTGQERRAVLFGELHLKLLEEYGPPSVVVNEAYNIVHLSEHAGRYLTFRAGEPSTNLLTVVHPQLQVELRTALFRASQSNESISVPDQRVELERGSEVLNLHIRPVHSGDAAQGFFVILFEKRTTPPAPEMVTEQRETADRELGDEVQRLKEQLNATVEQSEASNEELQASNEELQAMNEEMRSAAEELETSKEELQSVNEELTTVNHELKEKIEQLSRVNSDLQNLMAATDIGTIFLDRQLRVQRFTPPVRDIFNLQPSDLGRPIADITHKLQYEGLIDNAQEVLERLTPIEREVLGSNARHLLARIAPYRTSEDKISGVVLTFIDITARKRAEEEARAGAHRYRTLFELVPVAVYTTDAEGVIQEFNQRAVELWGRTPLGSEKFCGSFKIFHPDGRPMPHGQCPMARVLRGEELKPADLEILVEQENGTRRNVTVAPETVKDEQGNIAGAINCLHDITLREHAKELLRQSEERFRNVADNVPQVIWTNEAEGGANYFNRRWYDYTGLSFEDSVGSGWQAVVHPDDAPASIERWNKALAAGKVFDCEYRLRGRDDHYRWFIGRNVPLKDPSGRVTSWFGTATDIQDFKEAEAALRTSEARFRAMFEQANVGIMQLDASGRILSVNPGYCAIVGYTEDELRRMHVSDVIASDDWRRESRLIEQLAAGEIAEYTIEKRYRRKDGKFVWVSKTATLVRGESGEPLYTLGIVEPITERKEAEERLRSSEERYRLLVDGATDYAIFLLSPSNDIVYWSAGAERVFGWSAEEAVGQSGELIFTPEDRALEQEEKEIETALQEGCASDRRWHVRKDGSRIWVDGVMRRLDDEQTGALRGFAKIARNATEQRHAEERLREAHEELEERVKSRTAQLLAANTELQEEMKRRQALEREILGITERERARVGQDLHDGLCQELTATAFLLKSRAKNLARKVPECASALEEAAATVNENAGRARDLARGFHPSELGAGGLVAALRELATRTNERVPCRCECVRSLRMKDESVALNIYRIAQEAANNALKHARASEIIIRLRKEDEKLVLAVADNGIGVRSSRKKRKTMGIQMMKYRADVAGGNLEIQSRRGHGTTVTCRVPFES